MNVVSQLKGVLENYFSSYPNVSINALAMRGSVGATTLRRILNDSIKGEPSPHTVLNIVSAITKEKRLSKLVAMFDGPIGELLRSSFSAYIEVDAPHEYDADLNEVLRDRLNYFIYKLAANQSGVQENKVRELFGDPGVLKLKSLRKSGLLRLEDGHYHAKEKNFSLDLDIAKDHLPELVKFYRPDKLDDGLNLFYTLSESLSHQAVARIKEIQKEAAKRVYEIMNEQSNLGDVPYFTLQLCESFDYQAKNSKKSFVSVETTGVLQ